MNYSTLPPSPEQVAAVRSWFGVWHSLTQAQRDAWHALSRAEKDATYAMSAMTFARFMDELVVEAIARKLIQVMAENGAK